MRSLFKCDRVNKKHESTTEGSVFLLWHFPPGDKIENCPAQFLAVSWIVHVEFKVHRLRDGFSVSNPCCSANRFQRSSAITSIRLERERFSKDAICSSLFRCSSRTVRLSFALFLFFLDFAIGSFLHVVFHSRSRRLKAIIYTLKTRRKFVLDMRHICV